MPGAGLSVGDKGVYISCVYTWRNGCKREATKGGVGAADEDRAVLEVSPLSDD